MRVWVYQTLKRSPFMENLKGGLWATSALIEVPEDKPYAYYRMGITTGLLHESAPAMRTPFQIFVHDSPGDYELIDELLGLAKDALTEHPLTFFDPRVISCSFAQVSGDVPEDHLTGTIAKFTGFNLVHT